MGNFKVVRISVILETITTVVVKLFGVIALLVVIKGMVELSVSSIPAMSMLFVDH
jgi:hypothetical protein